MSAKDVAATAIEYDGSSSHRINVEYDGEDGQASSSMLSGAVNRTKTV